VCGGRGLDYPISFITGWLAPSSLNATICACWDMVDDMPMMVTGRARWSELLLNRLHEIHKAGRVSPSHFRSVCPCSARPPDPNCKKTKLYGSVVPAWTQRAMRRVGCLTRSTLKLEPAWGRSWFEKRANTQAYPVG
jgi:hypothetical protein